MKKILAPKKIRSRLRPLLTVAALFALNTVPAFAQSTTFSSTDLRTGISNSLAVIMMFGFVLGISCVTNMAAGVTGAALTAEEVFETGARVKNDFIALLKATIPRIAQTL